MANFDYEERPTPEQHTALDYQPLEETPGYPGYSGLPHYDKKWYGVPPVGVQPLPEKYIYILMLLGIFIIELSIWAVYRWATASFFGSFGTVQFYAVHIIAAPAIHLTPIILFWKYLRHEPGLPFKFTKKLLLSGVIIGFTAAIIWHLLEEFIYDGLAGAAGGTLPGTFAFFNILETPLLFGLMSFVHFGVVGPVEEFEFRSFTQDQASRVLPNWLALTFSSILFGCSHIPIAIFIYHFSPAEFVVALIGWITAGAVFGALYMWSRNIFASIVMHGMGNWQLSVFYFQSTQIYGGMDSFTAVSVGTVTSIIANAIMILIFYLIHKYYWEPHRRGEPAFGGRFLSLQRFIHEHDFEHRPVERTSIILVAFCVITCGLIVGATIAFGETDYTKLVYFPNVPEPNENVIELDSFIDLPETSDGLEYLDEGQAREISINSEPDKYVKSVQVTLTWTDEDDVGFIRYQNQPDTFAVSITIGNTTVITQAENPQGGQGRIDVELALTNENITSLITEVGENYHCIVTITMVVAGNQEPGVGIIAWTDPGNDYDYELQIIWLVPEE